MHHDIFISYSGERSRTVATDLSELITQTFPTLKAFVFPPLPGERTADSLFRELDGTRFGILCVTPENRASRWVHFEAGALLKPLDQSKVVPLLLDIDDQKIGRPLNEFVCTPATPGGIVQLMTAIAVTFRQPPPATRVIEESWSARLRSLRAASGASDLPLDESNPNLRYTTSNALSLHHGSNDFRKLVCSRILEGVARATRELAHHPNNVSSARDFVTRAKTALGAGEFALALCGGKPWGPGLVAEYYEANFEFALSRQTLQPHGKASVTRVFVEPDGGFSNEEWTVLNRHWVFRKDGVDARVICADQLADLRVPPSLVPQLRNGGFGFLAILRGWCQGEVFSHLGGPGFSGAHYESWYAVHEISRWFLDVLLPQSVPFHPTNWKERPLLPWPWTREPRNTG